MTILPGHFMLSKNSCSFIYIFRQIQIATISCLISIQFRLPTFKVIISIISSIHSPLFYQQTPYPISYVNLWKDIEPGTFFFFLKEPRTCLRMLVTLQPYQQLMLILCTKKETRQQHISCLAPTVHSLWKVFIFSQWFLHKGQTFSFNQVYGCTQT